MKIRHWGVGVLAAALFVPALTACNSESESSKETSAAAEPTAPAIPADPKEALLASTKEIKNGNFRFTMSGHETKGGGLVHAPTKSAQMTLTFADTAGEMSMAMDAIYVDKESWVKLEISGSMVDSVPGLSKMNSGKYQHLDQTRIKDVEDLSFDLDDPDPADSDKLIKAITEVKKTSEGNYAGKIDVTGVPDAGALDEEVVKSLGKTAASLSFTAKLDDRGRLTQFSVVLPGSAGAPPHQATVNYSDYGAATGAQQPPADQVVEASDETYEMFE